MKQKWITSILCFFWSILLVPANAQSNVPDGVWYNKHKDRIIIISSAGDGILVKGIQVSNRNTFFQYVKKHTLLDSGRNRIIFKNDRKLVYQSKGGLIKLTFIKIESHTPHVKELLHDQRHNTDHSDNISMSKPELQFRDIKLEGTWLAREINKYVYITDTRDGLKARLKDEKHWQIYQRKGDQPNIFISESGSYYTVNEASSLTWTSSDKLRNLTLIRISSEFE